MDPKKLPPIVPDSFFRRQVDAINERQGELAWLRDTPLWSRYSEQIITMPTKIVYMDLGPEQWELDQWKLALEILTDIIHVIVKAWYEDLMQDEARQRFSLLELD